MTITTAGLVIWAVLLIVIVAIVVPLAVALLRRGLKAARKIEAYLADMLTAGVGAAGHTAAVPALDRTIELSVAMKPVAESIGARTGAVAELLARRAG